ncbi:hypothetical protein A6B43_06055 [Vespertiliibacter pulmonis]|uniref:Uncharacterized protein n=1 Tax=Vespertiliibacter pulmonis TaxID=1443036 RepID=A0A3N4VR26_9PAST|nr:hypothetical protein [Vespertiliibacter pulmonis]QLB21113.1 hypothetical protein A6B43_06055 [Vespertiliibacter pulmonis]RPE83785.1 hypothetical protein EDC46_0988 [Vespertiliibacter pulmonis]
MEIKGIDLSSIREQRWLRKNYINLIEWIASIVISSALSIGIIIETIPLRNLSLENKKTLNIIKERIRKEELAISQLKNNQQNININYLQKEDLKKFIDYLTDFPVNGIIETSQLYEENGVKIKINGKLTNDSSFEKITKQIKNNNYSYKLENFQTNEDNKIEFSLNIKLIDGTQ